MNKNVKKKTTLLAILVAVLVVLLVGLTIVAVTEPWSKEPPATTDPAQTTTQPTYTESAETTEPVQTTTPVDTTAPTEQQPTVEADLELKTPYGTLRIDGQWRQYLDIRVSEGDPYVLEFRAKLLGKEPCKLFDLRFGSAVSDAIGGVKGKDGELVSMGVTNHVFRPDSTWSDAEINAIHSMQEIFNDLMDQLSLQDLPKVPETTAPKPTTGDLTISTPYGDFVYPREFEKYLVTEFVKGQPDALHLYSAIPGKEKVLLFTVNFGSGDGFESTIKNAAGEQTKIYFLFVEPEFDDTWAQTDINTVYAMQEGINHLIDSL